MMNTRTFHRVFFSPPLSTLFLLLTLTFSLSSGAAQVPDKQALADGIIAKVRKAVFGEIKLDSVKGLSLIWDVRRSKANGDEDTGQFACDLLLPNKYFTRDMQIVSGSQGQFIIYKLVNGDQSWSDVTTSGGEIQ